MLNFRAYMTCFETAYMQLSKLNMLLRSTYMLYMSHIWSTLPNSYMTFKEHICRQKSTYMQLQNEKKNPQGTYMFQFEHICFSASTYMFQFKYIYAPYTTYIQLHICSLQSIYVVDSSEKTCTPGIRTWNKKDMSKHKHHYAKVHTTHPRIEVIYNGQ